MDNLEIFKQEEAKYKGTLVLDLFHVALFVGMELNDPEDYYYILQKDRSARIWTSGVGRLIFLKDALSKEDYDYLVMVWNNNNIDKAI